MKKLILLSLTMFLCCFSYGQDITNGDFESNVCQNICDSDVSCIDGWGVYSGVPRRVTICDDTPCSGSYSLEVSSSESLGASYAQTSNPLNGESCLKLWAISGTVKITEKSETGGYLYVFGSNGGGLTTLGKTDYVANDEVCVDFNILLGPNVTSFDRLVIGVSHTPNLNPSLIPVVVAIVDDLSICEAMSINIDNSLCELVCFTATQNDGCYPVEDWLITISGDVNVELSSESSTPVCVEIPDGATVELRIEWLGITGEDFFVFDNECTYENNCCQAIIDDNCSEFEFPGFHFILHNYISASIPSNPAPQTNWFLDFGGFQFPLGNANNVFLFYNVIDDILFTNAGVFPNPPDDLEICLVIECDNGGTDETCIPVTLDGCGPMFTDDDDDDRRKVSQEMVREFYKLINKDSDLKVFPNPATDRVSIEFKVDPDVEYNLQILDMNGKLVKDLISSGKSIQANHNDSHELGLPAGMYIVKLETADGITKTSKLVVQ